MSTLITLSMLITIAGLSLALVWTLREIHREIAGQDDDGGHS